VSDEAIERLRHRRTLWKECLLGDDPNSVLNQLLALEWNYAAFRTINEARRLSPRTTTGGVAQSGLMHTLLNVCFWESQALGVRRLADSSDPLTPKGKADRSLYSLGAVLRDMREHAGLMTRGNWFAAEGLEYDASVVAERQRAHFKDRVAGGEVEFCVPEEFSVHRVSDLHRRIDGLAGVTPAERTSDDHVRAALFDELGLRMKSATNEIAVYANKFYAHAASPSSRKSENAYELSVTLNKLSAAHESLRRTHQFIGMQFYDEAQESYLAEADFDVLSYADQPLATAETIDALRAHWKLQEEQARDCKPWDLNELIPDAGTKEQAT